MLYILGMIHDSLGICHDIKIDELAMTFEDFASTFKDFAMNFADGRTHVIKGTATQPTMKKQLNLSQSPVKMKLLKIGLKKTPLI